MNIIGRIEPQPPKGIKYMLGDESWLSMGKRTPRRLHCEEWGNLGPMELNPDIHENAAGFRVRTTDITAPDGAHGFIDIDGVYFWTEEIYPELDIKPEGALEELRRIKAEFEAQQQDSAFGQPERVEG